MTEIGGAEFFLLLLIALVILGPKRLPEIANKIGSLVGQARRMTRVMKRQLEEELNTEDMKGTPFDSYVPRDDDDYSAAHAPGERNPNIGSVQSNVKASAVTLPDEDDTDTIPPPARDDDDDDETSSDESAPVDDRGDEHKEPAT